MEQLQFEPEDVRQALLGALYVYHETQQIIDGTKEGDLEEANRVSRLMAKDIISAFYGFHKTGRDADFFALIPLPFDGEHKIESQLLPPHTGFKALAEGQQFLEQSQSKEKMGKDILIATVGRNNVGKGIVTEYLKNKYGFTAQPLSDRVKEIATAFGHIAPHSRDVLITVGKEIKQLLGPAVLIRYAIALLSELDRPNRLLFDGLRVGGEAEGLLALQNDHTQIICIGITTGKDDEESDIEERYQRALKRGGEKDPHIDTPENKRMFIEQDTREAPGIIEAMKHATHIVVNKSGRVAETEAQIDEIMRQNGIESLD